MAEAKKAGAPDMSRLPASYRSYVLGLERENERLRAALEAEAPGSRMALHEGAAESERLVPERTAVRWWLSRDRHEYVEAKLRDSHDGIPTLEVSATSGLLVLPHVSNVAHVQSQFSHDRRLWLLRQNLKESEALRKGGGR